tara:strand:+ start:326 stop:688 length:363 start_codon:yes stop_codon:yes gene_type:complete
MTMVSCFYDKQSDLTRNEIRYLELETKIKCPICPAETIAESNTKISQDLKDFIKNKINEGWTDDQIKSFLVSKYGMEILATPDKKGIGLFLWIIPIIILIIASLTYFILYSNIRVKRRII